jgi:hypothetical protein
MMAIIAVAVLAFLLYITGAARRVLNACKLSNDPEFIQDHDPEPEPETETETAATASGFIESRKQLERIAACIITCEGYKGDSFGLVRELTTNELIDIINRGI